MCRFLLHGLGCIFLIVSSLSSFAAVESSGSDIHIKVRLYTGQKSFRIDGYNISVQKSSSPYQKVAISRNSKGVIISRIRIKNKFVWKVQRHDKDSVDLYDSKYLEVSGAELRHGGKSLPSALLFDGRSLVRVIGKLPLEDYLVGVLASEMPLNWPMQSLMAQAIAARSYALAVMRQRSTWPFHVDSTIRDQVFNHVSEGVDSSELVKRAKIAVEKTKGLILVSRGHTLKAYYHSNCGGHTTSARAVWGTDSGQGAVADLTCSQQPSTWSYQIARSDLFNKLNQYFNLDPMKEFDLSLQYDGNDKRVKKILVAYTDGSKKSLSSDQFRNILGSTLVRSTRFVLTKANRGWEFSGNGYGHGVGLCQWGSRGLAQLGWDYKRILSHYYKNAEVLIVKPAQEPLSAQVAL